MSIQSDEAKVISFGEVSDKEAAARLRSEPTGFNNVGNAVIQFKKVKEYTTFTAEYTVREERDIVMHFYLPPEMKQQPEEIVNKYWLETFPQSLNRVAQDYFQATFPRLMAKYTEEMGSWWFKAQGFGDCIDPDALISKFLERLDSDVDGTRS